MALVARRVAIAPKPIAASTPKTVAVGGAMKPVLVNTATLVRGRTYVYKDIHFKVHVPVVVSKEVADYLRDQFHEVSDSDNELIEKPYFDVQYDVEAPEEEKPVKRAQRLAQRVV